MIKSMIPWLLFPYFTDWLGGDFFKASLLVALLIASLCHQNLQRGALIESTLIVCVLAMATASLRWPGLSSFAVVKMVMYGALALTSYWSLFRGKPFTLQYSSDDVSEAVRGSWAFLHINRTITGTWCAAFLTNFILAGLSHAFESYWPLFLLGSYTSLLAASVITEVFPDAYFRKALAHA